MNIEFCYENIATIGTDRFESTISLENGKKIKITYIIKKEIIVIK